MTIIENESNSTFGGISPKLGYASFVSFILIVPNIIYKTHLFMIRKKWKKIYLYSNTKLKNSIYLYRKYNFKEVPLEKKSPYLRANIKMEINYYY